MTKSRGEGRKRGHISTEHRSVSVKPSTLIPRDLPFSLKIPGGLRLKSWGCQQGGGGARGTRKNLRISKEKMEPHCPDSLILWAFGTPAIYSQVDI